MTTIPVFRQVLAHADRPDAAARTALVCGERSLSYALLGAAVRNRAAVLAGRFGLGPGERAVLVAESTAGFIVTYLAVHSLGAVCVPVDPRIPPARLTGLLRRLEPRAVISGAESAANLPAEARYEELEGEAAAPAPEVDIAPEQQADILFTTGTASEPKGVMLRHAALATACAHINRFIGTRADAVEVLPLSLAHSFGLGRMRCVLSLGATLVLVPGFVHAAGIGRALVEHRATGFSSVPAGLAILLTEGDVLEACAERLEYVEIGSSAMPLEHKRRLMELLPHTRLCMHYGLTEASRSAFLEFHADRDRLDSIGRPSPGVRLRIVDEAGEPAAPGAVGQIEISGGHLMSGYRDDPELTGKTLHGGWLRSGDCGREDPDGYFYLEARADDVINIGGRKVLPREIEEILNEHPAVAECACAGLPDPQGLAGEIIAVWIVPKVAAAERPPFSELAKLLRRKLEPYKTPRQFHWTDQLPRSSSGKLQRRRLRELT